jgi:hypothetical protein
MKRQATAAELSGQRDIHGFIPASFKTGNSLDHRMEERTSRKTKHMAPEISGITHIDYAKTGQYPECIPFKVRED